MVNLIRFTQERKGTNTVILQTTKLKPDPCTGRLTKSCRGYQLIKILVLRILDRTQ